MMCACHGADQGIPQIFPVSEKETQVKLLFLNVCALQILRIV